MIATNSLAAFTQDVSRAAGIGGVGGVPPVRAPMPGMTEASVPPPQRLLESVPPAPAAPLPRGSLLDLRV